jgi:hypothetical protein
MPFSPLILEYSKNRPESRARRFFRRDLPLAIIAVLMLLITTCIVWGIMLSGLD